MTNRGRFRFGRLMASIGAVAVWGCGGAPAMDSGGEPAPRDVTARAAESPRVGESPAPGTMFLYPERIRLENGELVTADRGVIFVPADRSDPESEVIGVEVYRFRASQSAPGDAPAIFRLFGGPSFQGLEGRLSNGGYYEEQVRPFLDAADFVVVGQRGIGSSKPTTLCERPDPVPVGADAETLARAMQEASLRCQEYWREHGLDLSGHTVLEAAADVDDVRRALGYDEIQIWGGSFGSHWAMAYMRTYPERVQRALLRGLEGPDHTYDSPSGVLNAIAGIAAAADTAEALEGHIPEGGLLHAFKDVVDRLDEAPERVVTEDPITGEPVEVVVDGDAVRALATAGGVAGWPSSVLALHRGDLSAAAERVARRRAPGIQPASYYMLDCGSGITPERDARFQTDTAVAYIGDRNWSYRVHCEVWPSDLGDDFRQNFETDIPTVIVQGNWDTSTPLENALELAPYFTNSTFVLVEGGTHGALWQAMRAFPEFKEQIVEFFATGDRASLPERVVMPPVEWRMP